MRTEQTDGVPEVSLSSIDADTAQAYQEALGILLEPDEEDGTDRVPSAKKQALARLMDIGVAEPSALLDALTPGPTRELAWNLLADPDTVIRWIHTLPPVDALQRRSVGVLRAAFAFRQQEDTAQLEQIEDAILPRLAIADSFDPYASPDLLKALALTQTADAKKYLIQMVMHGYLLGEAIEMWYKVPNELALDNSWAEPAFIEIAGSGTVTYGYGREELYGCIETINDVLGEQDIPQTAESFLRVMLFAYMIQHPHAERYQLICEMKRYAALLEQETALSDSVAEAPIMAEFGASTDYITDAWDEVLRELGLKVMLVKDHYREIRLSATYNAAIQIIMIETLQALGAIPRVYTRDVDTETRTRSHFISQQSLPLHLFIGLGTTLTSDILRQNGTMFEDTVTMLALAFNSAERLKNRNTSEAYYTGHQTLDPVIGEETVLELRVGELADPRAYKHLVAAQQIVAGMCTYYLTTYLGRTVPGQYDIAQAYAEFYDDVEALLSGQPIGEDGAIEQITLDMVAHKEPVLERILAPERMIQEQALAIVTQHARKIGALIRVPADNRADRDISEDTES